MSTITSCTNLLQFSCWSTVSYSKLSCWFHWNYLVNYSLFILMMVRWLSSDNQLFNPLSALIKNKLQSWSKKAKGREEKKSPVKVSTLHFSWSSMYKWISTFLPSSSLSSSFSSCPRLTTNHLTLLLNLLDCKWHTLNYSLTTLILFHSHYLITQNGLNGKRQNKFFFSILINENWNASTWKG